MVIVHIGLAPCGVLRQVVVQLHARLRERLGSYGKGLGGGGMLAGNVTGRHGLFDNGEQRLSSNSIEHEHEPGLVDDDDGGNGFAIAMNIDESGRRLGVVVPDIVVDHLEIPEQFSGGSLCGDDGRAKEVVAGPICSDAIVVRSSKRHVDDAPLLIDRHVTPDVDAGALLPAVATPGVVACFSRAWHRVERPYQLPGMYVPCARISGGAEPAARASLPFSGSCAGDDEIFIDDWRRGQNVELVRARAHDFGGTKIDGSVVAESRVDLSGCRTDRIKEAMIGSEEEGGAGGCVSGPICGSSQRCLI